MRSKSAKLPFGVALSLYSHGSSWAILKQPGIDPISAIWEDAETMSISPLKHTRHSPGFGSVVSVVVAGFLVLTPAASAVGSSADGIESYLTPQRASPDLSGLLSPARGHSILEEARTLAEQALKPAPTMSSRLSALWTRMIVAFEVATGRYDFTQITAQDLAPVEVDEMARRHDNNKCDQQAAKTLKAETLHNRLRTRRFFAF